MPNMSLKKVEMPTQDAKVRATNFEEVSLGYTEAQAIEEASRCLNCKNPKCVELCPVNIDIPGFISKIVNKDYEGAYKIISNNSLLPSICGRVCPQENQCEKECVRSIKGEAVGVGRLERFVADYHDSNGKDIITKAKTNGKKIAVIGSGPSGLTCAADLARLGYEVTVFEALHILGGVLAYGIPEFRLPKKIVEKEISKLNKLGVEFKMNTVIGKTITIDELLEEHKYDAVYIASGAGLPKFMNIKGENLNGVYSANEYLTRINLMKAYKDSPTPILKANKVAVIGGGNVAMDAARAALRLGAKEVYIVYRRSIEELPARKEEVEHAKEEGIIFKLLNNPVEIIGNEKGFVKALRCIKMELGEPDDSGRRKPVEIKGSEFEIEVDAVIEAIGTSPNPLIKKTTKGLVTEKWGGISINEDDLSTSKERVFAGGDAVSGSATVILAMGAGKKAAKAIDNMINKNNF